MLSISSRVLVNFQTIEAVPFRRCMQYDNREIAFYTVITRKQIEF